MGNLTRNTGCLLNKDNSREQTVVPMGLKNIWFTVELVILRLCESPDRGDSLVEENVMGNGVL